jgi:hypothetical protein
MLKTAETYTHLISSKAFLRSLLCATIFPILFTSSTYAAERAARASSFTRAVQPQYKSPQPVVSTPIAAPIVKSEDDQKEKQQQAELDHKNTQIMALREDIKLIDADISKCKKKKTGWGVAMGVGAAATVGLGVSALVNKSKISSKEEDLDTKKKTKGTAE